MYIYICVCMCTYIYRERKREKERERDRKREKERERDRKREKERERENMAFQASRHDTLATPWPRLPLHPEVLRGEFTLLLSFMLSVVALPREQPIHGYHYYLQRQSQMPPKRTQGPHKPHNFWFEGQR